MPGPDYLQFKSYMESQRNDLQHSPKGTTWKDHKYIKKENGKYIYPNESSFDIDKFNKETEKNKQEYLDAVNQKGEFWDKYRETKSQISQMSSIMDKYERENKSIMEKAMNDFSKGKILSFIKGVSKFIDNIIHEDLELQSKKLVEVPPAISQKGEKLLHKIIHKVAN